jgi:putative toxin-antitoxin system antitoxin component (TIGR02293 family)
MSTSEVEVFIPKRGKGRDKVAHSKRERQLRSLLKLPPRGKLLIDAIKEGFPADMLRQVAGNLSIDIYKIGSYINIKTATLDKRLREGTLMPIESDRLNQFIEVYDAALELFDGDQEITTNWLKTPAHGLWGERPFDLLSTATGTMDVLALIHKIEHGVLV